MMMTAKFKRAQLNYILAKIVLCYKQPQMKIELRVWKTFFAQFKDKFLIGGDLGLFENLYCRQQPVPLYHRIGNKHCVAK
jgi:hypothetical protein